jgi:hypothetical protein
MPKTVMLKHILADGRESFFASEINIGRAIHVPAALEPEGCFQLAQRGRLTLRIAKLELSPVLSANRPGTSLRLVARHGSIPAS